MAKQVDTKTRTFAVVDRTGKLFPTIERAAQVYNEQAVDSKGQVVRPRLALAQGGVGSPDDAAALELSDKVRRGELTAFAVIPAGAIERRGPTPPGPWRWNTTPTTPTTTSSATGWPPSSTPRSARDGSAPPAWTPPWPIG